MPITTEKCFKYTDPFIPSIELQSPHVNYEIKLDYIMPIKDGSHIEFRTFDRDPIKVKTDMTRVLSQITTCMDSKLRSMARNQVTESLMRNMQVIVMNHIYNTADSTTYSHNTWYKRLIHKMFGVGKIQRVLYKIFNIKEHIEFYSTDKMRHFFNDLITKHKHQIYATEKDKFDQFIIIGQRNRCMFTTLHEFQMYSYGNFSNNMLPYHFGMLWGTDVYVDPELELDDARIFIGHRLRSKTKGTVVVYNEPEIIEIPNETRPQKSYQAQAYYSIVDLFTPTKYYSVSVK